MPLSDLPHQHGDHMKLEQLQAHLQKVENFQTVADVFKQLADSTRVRIFWLLCHCEECVINLSAMMEMSSPAVMHHLNRLKAAKLIVSERKGKEVYYKAAETPQADLLHHTIEKLVEISCPAERQESA